MAETKPLNPAVAKAPLAQNPGNAASVKASENVATATVPSPQTPPPGQTVPLPVDPAETKALARTKGVKTTGARSGEDPDELIPVITLRKAFTSDGRTMEKGERGNIPAKDFNSTVYERISQAKAMREAPNSVRQRQLVDSGSAEVPNTDEESAEVN